MEFLSGAYQLSKDVVDRMFSSQGTGYCCCKRCCCKGCGGRSSGGGCVVAVFVVAVVVVAVVAVGRCPSLLLFLISH